jgi:hypothetical protein
MIPLSRAAEGFAWQGVRFLKFVFGSEGAFDNASPNYKNSGTPPKEL